MQNKPRDQEQLNSLRCAIYRAPYHRRRERSVPDSIFYREIHRLKERADRSIGPTLEVS